jgi:hypothetical protein
MLDLALGFMRNELNAYLAARTGSDTIQAKLTRVVDEAGKYAFPQDSLALSLIHVEEERTFRAQLPSHFYVNGESVTREPELQLNLHMLLAANFKQYDEALKHLSLVLTFFQSHQAFTAARHPALDPRIEKLTVELQSLTYEQLNQLWGFIGGKQLPSVVYKVRMVVLQDVEQTSILPPITAITSTATGR